MKKTASIHQLLKNLSDTKIANEKKHRKTKSASKKIIMSRHTVLLIFIATLFGHLGETAIIYFSVLLHELAHLAICVLIKIPVSGITVYPYGMRLQITGLIPPREQILISAGGPAVNLILFALGKIIEISGLRGHHILFFTGVNFLLLVFNMLPCVPLDGSEILRSLISIKKGIIYSYTVIIRLSEIMILFIFASGCILAFFGKNISLLIVLTVLTKSLATKKYEQIIAAKQIISEEIKSCPIPKIISAKAMNYAHTYIKYISFGYTVIILRDSAPPVVQSTLLKAVKSDPAVKICDI